MKRYKSITHVYPDSPDALVEDYTFDILEKLLCGHHYLTHDEIEELKDDESIGVWFVDWEDDKWGVYSQVTVYWLLTLKKDDEFDEYKEVVFDEVYAVDENEMMPKQYVESDLNENCDMCDR